MSMLVIIIATVGTTIAAISSSVCWLLVRRRCWQSFDRTTDLLMRDLSPNQRAHMGQTIIELARSLGPERPPPLPYLSKLPRSRNDAGL
jgi:hypothetical protein